MNIKFTAQPVWDWDKLTTADGGKWEGGSTPFRKDLQAGDAYWVKNEQGLITHLSFVCPCGDGAAHMIPVCKGQGYGWVWDGNEQQPSLTPSIRILTACGWHGYLTKGEWRRC